MGQAHCRIRRIDALSAVAGCPHDVNTDIFFIYLDIYILRFRHDSDRNRGSMNTSAGLCLGHPLHPMYPGFVFHHRIGSFPVDHEGHILHAAYTDLFAFHQFYFPSLALCIMEIHAVDLGREQGRLIPAGTGTDLDYDILIIIGVLGQKQNLKFML